MTKVLVTGGSGFIASHILDQLLAKGHKVVTTVRSEAKAQQLRAAFPGKGEDELQIAIVPDIAEPGAFDEVVKVPGLEVVMHTASPFHFQINDPKKDFLDPAINGTTGLLAAIARSAPLVRRVVVTSSFAAIFDRDKIADPSAVFTESSWNPVTMEDGLRDPAMTYVASKKLAEEAAWAFVEDPKNNKDKVGFELATVCPPLVFGPLVKGTGSLAAINASNAVLLALARGQYREAMPPSMPVPVWVDVRDVALAHVRAGLDELPSDADGMRRRRRFFPVAGFFSNRRIVKSLRERVPEIADRLPGEDAHGGEDVPEDRRFRVDNSETMRRLGIEEWTPLEKSVEDTVRSLLAMGA